MGAAGMFLRFFNFAIRVLQTLDAGLILAIFSYYLASLAENNQPIARWVKATEGISGAATLYALLGCVFTCCLGGVPFFAFVAMVLDVCFVGGMIAIAVMTRSGSQSCSGAVNTPVGTGAARSDSTLTGANLGLMCRLEKAAFAVSISGIFFFLLSILSQLLLARFEKREKRFGPSPANGYTYGTRRHRFWWSRRKQAGDKSASLGDDNLPSNPTPQDVEYGNADDAAEKSCFYKPDFLSGRSNKNAMSGGDGNAASPYGRY